MTKHDKQFAQARWGDFWEDGWGMYSFLKKEGSTPNEALRDTDEWVEEQYADYIGMEGASLVDVYGED